MATAADHQRTRKVLRYVGTGVFLVASVLDRFLGLYAAVNSFTQLVARAKQGEEILKKWPPRAGELPLL